MQACSLSRACRNLLVAVLLLSAFCGFSQTRQIRLRNETIATPSKTNSLAKTLALSSQTTVSGLFLVQAEGHLPASAQAQLTAQGVELLKYVPDDAFIARFKNVSIPGLCGIASGATLPIERIFDDNATEVSPFPGAYQNEKVRSAVPNLRVFTSLLVEGLWIVVLS
jgi:hypothetical protein